MYDPNIGYDTSLDVHTISGLRDNLAWIGLSSIIRSRDIFRDPNLSKLMLSEHIIQKYSELISEQSYLNIICSKAFRNKVNLYQHPTWTNFLDKMFASGLKEREIIFQACRGEDHYINYYLDWNKDVDWMEIYSLYSQAQKVTNYLTQPFIKALNKFFETNPLCARTTIEMDLFESDTKPEVGVRGEMYCAYIKAGFLDKKKARKIRSEPSEAVSAKALGCLIDVATENPNLYPNYYEMILQFTDTKHHAVQYLLADKAPYSLLYAFVGFDSSHAKNIIERRMQNGK